MEYKINEKEKVKLKKKSCVSKEGRGQGVILSEQCVCHSVHFQGT